MFVDTPFDYSKAVLRITAHVCSPEQQRKVDGERTEEQHQVSNMLQIRTDGTEQNTGTYGGTGSRVQGTGYISVVQIDIHMAGIVRATNCQVKCKCGKTSGSTTAAVLIVVGRHHLHGKGAKDIQLHRARATPVRIISAKMGGV